MGALLVIALIACWFFWGWQGVVTAIVCAVAVIALLASRSTESDDDATPRRRSRRRAAITAPEEWVARWKVRYVAANGERTSRIVRVIQVQPSAQQLQVWCELRNAQRTLKFDRLESIVDVETGEIIELLTWLKERRATGRAVKQQPMTRRRQPEKA